MTRIKMRDRRPSANKLIHHTLESGKELSVHVTFGFDEDTWKVKELFTADFKAGTDLHTMIIDASVVLSLLLQHGYGVQELEGKLAGKPRSLLGSLVRAAVEIEEEYRDRGPGAPTHAGGGGGPAGPAPALHGAEANQHDVPRAERDAEGLPGQVPA